MDVLNFLKNNTVILDGAMGTLLQANGLQPGEYPERWNVSHPEVVTEAHRAYFDAGSNIVLTNTFGANTLKFEEKELKEILRAAVRNARNAAAASKGKQEKFVALDIGPLGRLLAPYGDLDFEEAVSIFSKTVRSALIGHSSTIQGENCPDLVFIETMNDSYETKAALLAVRENCDLPVFVSNSYGQDGRLMTGALPEAMVAMLEGMGADAIGLNCSLGPVEMRPVIEQYLKLASVPVIVKPNAGLPQVENGRTVFTVSPEGFAEEVAELARKGARLVGGCCGTNPDYIRALAEKCAGDTEEQDDRDNKAVLGKRKTEDPVSVSEKAGRDTVISSYTHAVRFGREPVVIGERINPTGKKRLKQALMEKDMTYILKEADGQAEAGSDVLDVNAGMPEINEAEMLPLLVKEIQAVTDLPLVIDTADKKALEKALRVYNGKPLINSVNGKQESMDAVFPLMKKYGGACIALTLDESGIPETAEGRFRVAEKIIKEAAKYGIDKKEFIVDPLALTVSASSDAAMVTLETVRMIRERLGVCTSLGVSNISFGLPERTVVNRTFYALALEQGLSAAILNPYSADMMETSAAFRLLHGLDTGCSGYIDLMMKKSKDMISSGGNAADRNQTGAVTGDTKTVGKTAGLQDKCAGAGASEICGVDTEKEEGFRELYSAVTRGLKELAAGLAKDLLKTEPSMRLIDQAVIPALNEVGDRFEQKKLFLPQLLLSAEAASEVFEAVKQKSTGGSGAKHRGKVVLATVHGDIHDIGKGIVRLLLENYGFDVLDLGKDVPEDKVVEAVIRENAPLCGLSALMTTTVPAMEKTVKLLHENCPGCKVVVGGAVLTESYAEKIGADKYAATAMDTVRYAETILQNKKEE